VQRRGWAFSILACVVLTAQACGDDANDEALRAERVADLAAEFRATQTTAPGAPVTTVPGVEPTGVVVPVVSLDNSFRPETIEIQVGDEVVWENRGRNDHDVLSIESGAWGVQVEDFGPGAVYAHVFTEPGEYRYYCSVHGTEQVGMVGTVFVSA
jgi:plastocyanin